MKNKYLIRLINYLKLFLRNKKTLAYRKWIRDEGDNTLRLNYPLKTDSIVFDVGAYKGLWSKAIIQKFNSKVFLFEPILSFHEEIKKNIMASEKTVLFGFGLSDRNETVTFHCNNDATSQFRKDDRNNVFVELKDISEVISKNNITRIDLLKINIEGGEYKLLQRLIDTKLISICVNIQVQFHSINKHSVIEYNALENQLSKTHKKTWGYYFIWENWRLSVH
jgi:FkbM family methyltransferase